jgi:enoyl-CoA hydratase
VTDVSIEVGDGLAVIKLDRPDARNALDSGLLRDLPALMTEADHLDEVAVVVLTGSDPAFCAGLDLKELASSGANLRPADGRPWPELTKPLIGAVNGPAVTGGLELALACDFLVASERARFADTHTRVGLVPFWGMSVLLPQAIGLRKAREMSLTGNFIDAEEAFRLGLVNLVVPHDQLMVTALRLAADVADCDPSATRAMLRTYRQVSGTAEAFDVEVRLAEAFVGEGIDAAVLEQRRQALLGRSRDQRATAR